MTLITFQQYISKLAYTLYYVCIILYYLYVSNKCLSSIYYHILHLYDTSEQEKRCALSLKRESLISFLPKSMACWPPFPAGD